MAEELRELRLSKQIPAKDMVAVVQAIYCRNGGYHAITGGKIHPCRTAEAAPVLCSTEMDGQSMSVSKEKRCLT